MSLKRSIDNELLIREVCAALADGRMVKLRAKGNSMWPTIHGNEDVLMLSQQNGFRRGDVVLARTTEGNAVIHRIIKIKGERIVLAGDNNLARTEECLRESIYGRVEAIVRNGRPRSITGPWQRMYALARRQMFPIRRLFGRAINTMKSQIKV